MVEILKSKVLMGFAVFVVGVIYFNACTIDNKNVMEESSKDNLVVLNEN